jgi:hypothetical protein
MYVSCKQREYSLLQKIDKYQPLFITTVITVSPQFVGLILPEVQFS